MNLSHAAGPVKVEIPFAGPFDTSITPRNLASLLAMSPAYIPFTVEAMRVRGLSFAVALCSELAYIHDDLASGNFLVEKLQQALRDADL